MQIHVVQSGESLYEIANAYGVSFEEIAVANELPDPSQLVIGQALVIPVEGAIHIVQQGQSLYTIAQLFQTTPEQLANLNGISINTPLQIDRKSTRLNSSHVSI